MPKYCKAYKLEDLRKFPQWADSVKEAGKDLDDDSIVYIQENFIVTNNPLDLESEEDYILDRITPEWEAFCKDTLNFEVPQEEDLAPPSPQEGAD